MLNIIYMPGADDIIITEQGHHMITISVTGTEVEALALVAELRAHNSALAVGLLPSGKHDVLDCHAVCVIGDYWEILDVGESLNEKYF